MLSDEYFEDNRPRGFGEVFHIHAAPEAIAAELVDARRKLREAEATVNWLQQLQAKRATQVMKGEWPARAGRLT